MLKDIQDLKIKFYNFCYQAQEDPKDILMCYKSTWTTCICRYALNTVVHYPHDKKVVDLKFRPYGDDLDVVHSVVTSSVDGKFKTWTLVDDTDIYSE